MAAPQELGLAKWDMAREPLAAPLQLLRRREEACEPHSKRVRVEDDGVDLRAETVDWTALHRIHKPPGLASAESGRAAVQPTQPPSSLEDQSVVLDPFAIKVRLLIKQLSAAESKASRAVVDEYAALVKAAPADMSKKLLVPLLEAGCSAHCELAQVLAKDCLGKAELSALSHALLQREDLQWSDEFVLFWQKGLLPGLGEVSPLLLRQLLVSLEMASKSAKLAGLVFLVCKMAGPAVLPHAAAYRRVVEEKCSGPLVAQILKLL